MKSRPNIVIAVNDGMAARYLLRSSVLKYLRDSGHDLIILSPNTDEEYFREEYALPGVRLAMINGPGRNGDERLEQLLRRLRYYAVPIEGTRNIIQIKYREFLGSNSLRPSNRLVFRILVGLTRRSRGVRRALLQFEARQFNRHSHCDLFSRHTISAVVTCSPGYAYLQDAYLLREARYHRVPTVCTIPMWDHPSTMGYRAASSDHTLVWGPSMRDEWVHYQDGQESLEMTGSTVFDLYANPKTLKSHADFFSRYDLDPSRRLLLFATISPIGFPYNVDVARHLAEAIAQNRFGEPCQLLIRLHPNHFRDDAMTPINSYEKLATEFPFVRLSVPKILSRRLLGDMPDQENIEVANMVWHSDLMINFFSTMQLDAAICDRPIVNVGFNLGPNCTPSKNPANFEFYTHLARVVRARATRNAGSYEELDQHIEAYLRNPKLESPERKKLVELECGLADGKAGKRIAEYILSIAEKKDREKGTR